jgi:hypothetical protein
MTVLETAMARHIGPGGVSGSTRMVYSAIHMFDIIDIFYEFVNLINIFTALISGKWSVVWHSWQY